ncbi:hypothetical protein FSP39_005926 [Pinctada imbricata]|uniref:CCHC-type domain-containing protein n=1 Tax=Pinctada imbricata TaxID=66713 RepID=A0AA88YLS4_PINIB|nr:hypothetical protein FSP39_005926 [Pinctada imbricata]
MGLLAKIKQNWFLSGLVIVILLAKLAPSIGSKGGVLKPEITVKFIAVFIIFFNSGITLKSEDLTKALLQVKIHVCVQGFTFIVFPFIIHILVSLLESGPFDADLLQGLLVLGCMPPPVSSAVILTKAVGGNEAAAIFNSAFGSFLGIFVTPALILSVVGSNVDVPVSSIFIQLSLTVVLPLILGQILRKHTKVWLERQHIPFGSIGSAILLLIIYTTFCDTFYHAEINLDVINLFSIIFLIVIIQCVLLVVIFYVSTRRSLSFRPRDTVALMFCCTHKSLTLGNRVGKDMPRPVFEPGTSIPAGIPIIKILFSGDPGLSVITIPLLVYHPTQILLGGVLVPTVRGWMLSTEKYSRHFVMDKVIEEMRKSPMFRRRANKSDDDDFQNKTSTPSFRLKSKFKHVDLNTTHDLNTPERDVYSKYSSGDQFATLDYTGYSQLNAPGRQSMQSQSSIQNLNELELFDRFGNKVILCPLTNNTKEMGRTFLSSNQDNFSVNNTCTSQHRNFLFDSNTHQVNENRLSQPQLNHFDTLSHTNDRTYLVNGTMRNPDTSSMRMRTYMPPPRPDLLSSKFANSSGDATLNDRYTVYRHDLRDAYRSDPRSDFATYRIHEGLPQSTMRTNDLPYNSPRLPHRNKKQKEPDKFDGNSQEFQDYLPYFERIAIWNDWTSYEAAEQLAMSLTGSAQKALIGLSRFHLSNYEALTQVLNEYFYPPERMNAYRCEFRNRQRHANETANDYGKALLQLSSKAFPNLDDETREFFAVDQYILGLRNNEMKRHVQLKYPKSIKDAVSETIAYESTESFDRFQTKPKVQFSDEIHTNYAMKHEKGSKNNDTNVYNDVMRAITEGFQQISAKLSDQNSPRARSPVPLRDNSRDRDETREHNYPTQRGSGRRIVCDYCGKSGHIQPRCWQYLEDMERNQRQENQRPHSGNENRLP